MNNWTIKKRIVFGFATVLGLVTILAAVSFFMLRNISGESDFMDASALPGVTTIVTLEQKVSEIQIKTLRVLLSDNAEEREKFIQQIEANRSAIAELMEKYSRNISAPEDQRLFQNLEARRADYMAQRGRLFELVHTDRINDAVAFNATHLRAAYEGYLDATAKLHDYNLDQAGKSSARARNTSHRANTLILSLSAGVILLAVVIASMIVAGLNRALGRVSRTLGDGSATIVSAARQVSAAGQSLAEGASEQAASLEETSASMEELSSITKRNAENAQKANEITREARVTAEAGAADMHAMNQAMEAIRNSSDDIAKIIRTIDEIAFQTNILALNAAVEAARAGEAGMGFAVVADEVRNLAQRCAQSAKETSGKIESAIATTSQGVELSSKVTRRLEQIVAQVRRVDELAAEVANASSEQSQGISQVSTAINQIDKVTQSNAATAEQSAGAAQEMNSQAEALKQAVNELLRLTGTRFEVPSAKSIPAKLTQSGKSSASVTGNGNGHVPRPRLQAAFSSAPRRSEIPLEGDFKDF